MTDWRAAFDALPNGPEDPRWVQHFCCECSAPITDKRFQKHREPLTNVLCDPCGLRSREAHRRWVHYRAT